MGFRALLYPRDLYDLKRRLNREESLDSEILTAEEAKQIVKIEVNNGLGRSKHVKNIVELYDGEIIGEPTPIYENTSDKVVRFFSKHLTKFIIAYVTIVAGALINEMSGNEKLVDIAFLIAFPWIPVLIVSILPAIGNVLGIKYSTS